MTVFPVLFKRIAAVGVCCVMVLAGGAANAQLDGRVVGTGFAGLANAHVEVWDSYPDGSRIANSVISDANGNFSFSGLSGSSWDLRVWKGDLASDLYYPTVLFDVSAGTWFAGLAKTPGLFISGLVMPCDFADPGMTSTFLNFPLRRGDVVGVMDPDGVWCGMLTWPKNDSTYLVHVYGDDPTSTGVDEGAEAGDVLTFFINNKPAELVGAVGIWSFGGSFLQSITGTTTNIEGVKVVSPASMIVSSPDFVELEYEITNTGNQTDSYNLSVASVGGWTVSLPGGAVTGSMIAGATETITVSVGVPPGIFVDVTDYVFLSATSTANVAVVGVGRGTLDVLATGILEEEQGVVPEQFYLGQNFPNPFNPSTTIAYGLEVGGPTTIKVYNLLGQAVAVVLDEYRPAGNHQVFWDGRNLYGDPVPSGIYFYRMRSGDSEQTRKMVLMK